MNDSRNAGGAALVAVLLLLIVLIALGGLAVGFLFLGVRSGPTPIGVWKAPTPAPVATLPVGAAPQVLGQLELSELDKKDSLEAPAIAVAPNGDVLVAYASQTGKEERTLRLARFRNDQAVGEPTEICKTQIHYSVSQQDGKEVRRPIRLLPQLAVGGGKVFLGWVEPDADNTAVFYYVAQSNDDGQTFGAPLRVHESDGARPAFTGIGADADGNLAASWLDNRAGIKQPFVALKRAGETKFAPEQQMYSAPGETGVCPCCPTAVLIAHGQVFCAFRNDFEGYRDIWMTKIPLAEEGDYMAVGRVVKEPTWKFDGCPHDGPSLAADSQNLYVTYMDASSGVPRCYWTMKPLGGGNFTPPQLLHPQSSAAEGNAKVVSFGEGIVAVWESSSDASATADAPSHEATSGGSRTILLGVASRMQSPQGASLNWDELMPIVAPSGAFQTRPALAIGSDGMVFVAWNELDEQGKRVVVARASQVYGQ